MHISWTEPCVFLCVSSKKESLRKGITDQSKVKVKLMSVPQEKRESCSQVPPPIPSTSVDASGSGGSPATPSGGAGWPSDSGYATDSPASANTSNVRFSLEPEICRYEAMPRERHQLQFNDHSDDELDDDILNMNDDDVFDPDIVDGATGRPDRDPHEEADTSGTSSTSSVSQPRDIPRSPLSSEHHMSSPVHQYSPHEALFSPQTRRPILNIGSPCRSSTPAEQGEFHTFLALTNRLDISPRCSPSHGGARPKESTGKSRPRFYSDGDNLRPSRRDNLQVAPTEANDTLRPLRNRALSEPAIQSLIRKEYGAQLRKISDEFDKSYESIRINANGGLVPGEYPMQRRRSSVVQWIKDVFLPASSRDPSPTVDQQPSSQTPPRICTPKKSPPRGDSSRSRRNGTVLRPSTLYDAPQSHLSGVHSSPCLLSPPPRLETLYSVDSSQERSPSSDDQGILEAARKQLVDESEIQHDEEDVHLPPVPKLNEEIDDEEDDDETLQSRLNRIDEPYLTNLEDEVDGRW